MTLLMTVSSSYPKHELGGRATPEAKCALLLLQQPAHVLKRCNLDNQFYFQCPVMQV
jgi:hypothetical protein